MRDFGIVVLISANSEWQAVKEILAPSVMHSTRMGEYFDFEIFSKTQDPGTTDLPVRFFHGGWGKISAAATTQFAIDHWQPNLLVNLGTCGGFEGRIGRGAILLVTKTIVYDIIEQMSDPADAINHYSADLDLTWLKEPYPYPVQPGLLVSGDRDIIAAEIPSLVEKFGANAADWESGAIAWVANKNNLPCLILRGVTDLVSASGGEAYGNIEIFHQNTRQVMKTLIKQLPDWRQKFQTNSQIQPTLFKKVDCIRLYVSNLEEGLAFYRDKLGQQLIWRTGKAAGLQMPGSETEIVIQSEDKYQEVDLTVISADLAARQFADAGGRIVVPPFDIQIGRCTVVCDPWGNQLVLLDSSKGYLLSNNAGNVIGKS